MGRKEEHAVRRAWLLVMVALVAGWGMGVAPPARVEYLFCFWNVENLFDDVDDGRGGADGVFDKGFSGSPDLGKLKLEKLVDVLLPLNEGRGPDVIGLCEVESKRAAELLRDALNAGLARAGEKAMYGDVAWAGAGRGRHIGPAVISRLVLGKAVAVKKGLRILRVPVSDGDVSFNLVVAHWTSQLPEPGDPDGAKGRERYARAVRADFGEMGGEYVAGGDFNEPPVAQLAPMKSPFAGLDGGSYWKGRWQMLDQVWLSPGMADGKGWEYVDGSAVVVGEMKDGKGHPLRFGTPGWKGVRGASDHFPVTVRLRVVGK